MSASRRALLGPALAVGFQLLASLAFLGKPVHLDEALYLPIAGQALRDPLHPLGFELYWFGRVVPASIASPHPPTLGYLLAPSAALERWGEAAMRLAALPYELAAALFLYLLAARFLKRPLLPVLAVLAGPGWWVSVQALQLEKLMAAFGFAALYCATRADPRRVDRWWRASGLLAAVAAATKYPAAIFPLAAAAWLWRGGARPRLVAAWLAAAFAPVAAFMAWQLLDPERLRFVAIHSTGHSTGAAHHWRALLAFVAGCAPGAMAWAWWSGAPRRALVAAATAGALLYLPGLDLAPATGADRVLGVLLGSAGAAALAAGAWSARGASGGALWAALGGATLLLQGFAYWSVVARFTMFLSAALALLLAERLEAALPERAAGRLAAAGFALSLVFGVLAASADAAFARASRDAALELTVPELQAGRRVWFTGHWGFQHYQEKAGARALDGGWSAARPGDRVVVPGVNTNVVRPARPVRADVRVAEPSSPAGLLLMCGRGWACQAGFHSSLYGFLPFSFSREPLDRFEVLELK